MAVVNHLATFRPAFKILVNARLVKFILFVFRGLFKSCHVELILHFWSLRFRISKIPKSIGVTSVLFGIHSAGVMNFTLRLLRKSVVFLAVCLEAESDRTPFPFLVQETCTVRLLWETASELCWYNSQHCLWPLCRWKRALAIITNCFIWPHKANTLTAHVKHCLGSGNYVYHFFTVQTEIQTPWSSTSFKDLILTQTINTAHFPDICFQILRNIAILIG